MSTPNDMPTDLLTAPAMAEPTEVPAPAVTPALRDEELAATFTNDSAMMIAFDTKFRRSFFSWFCHEGQLNISAEFCVFRPP